MGWFLVLLVVGVPVFIGAYRRHLDVSHGFLDLRRKLTT